MSTKAATTRERNRRRTIGALQAMIAATTTAPAMRRAATLRLSRLRAATAPRPVAATARAKPPVLTGKAVYEAVTSFHALARQRAALMRKRRTAGERVILSALITLMPDAVPQGNDAKPWSDFIGRVDLMLEEVRNIKNL